MKPISRRLLADAVRLADGLAVLAASAIAFYVYVAGVLDAEEQAALYFAAATISALGYLAIAQALQAYRYDRLSNVIYMTQRALVALSVMAIGWLLVGFITKTTEFWSRGWTLLWLVLSTVLIIAVRLGVAVVVARWRRQRRWQDRIVIVGATEMADELIKDIRQHGGADAEIVGVFDERGGNRRPSLADLPFIGNVEALIEYTREHRVDSIVLALPWSSEERIIKLSEKLSVLPVDINVAFATRMLHRHFTSAVGAYGVPLMQIGRRPLTDRQVLMKRIEDLVLTCAITFVLSPIMLIVALLIRMESSGPILFRQPRNGFNDTIITVYKFRTMYVERSDPSGVKRTEPGDPRVTPLGRTLRRWSLDELPQLFNVLKGDMSVVGPRPHPVGMLAATADYRQVVSNYAARHRMKPGITGWAQVAGYRGTADTVEKAQRRVEFDLEYIAHWSLLFDLRILMLTAIAMISGKEAY
ncbi:MAG: undecaprenyl-phosphate glucose phosphotransferase [Proteobacteria bacterium]|nr:undecaprenyl-phosphate glucose phosphotransferase [Pseudomonadota bacterium]MBI3497933.1 undecaprenyl-phosphate glucose phosphotransferase [Pseudomonadota bacterium]